MRVNVRNSEGECKGRKRYTVCGVLVRLKELSCVCVYVCAPAYCD